MTAQITLVGFDADDTLWENEHFFRLTETHFRDLLADYAQAEKLSAQLLEAEKRNIKHYGFGIKGFTLSMIETAIEITDGKVPASTISKILNAGREMLSHPVETLPEAEHTLQTLSATHKLVLITKGDLFDQERKLAQSGLGDYFEAVEIVSDKSTKTYQRIFTRHGTGAAHAVMVGNSLKSDVIPAIDAGAFGVHIPHQLTWDLEHAEPPTHQPRYRAIKSLGELVPLINTFG